MEGRDTPNNLLSFAEDGSSVHGEHSRASSQHRPQPRLPSASSKGRNVPSVRNFYDTNSNRLKSSIVTLKDIKKARLEEREDNLPTLQFDQVKWIPIIKAYDPTRLKNITVKKKSFEEFFGRHNPNQDPLGQLYIQSVIDHFKQWQAKLNRRYGRILDQFLGSSQTLNCQQIEAELDSIEKNTRDLKDTLNTILGKYENHRIRKLIEGFHRSLEKASEIMAIIKIIYESKQKMEKVLEKLEGKKQLRRILKNLRDKEIEQTREVFRNHPPNRFEDEIVQRVSQAITAMADMTVEAVDQLQSMKHIVERIQRILQNREETLGLKGLDQINQVFESVLDEARVFEESSSRIHQNNFFNDEFKKKVTYYEKEMRNKKTLIVEYIFSMVDSILAGMVETFQQYQSLVEPLQRQPENFSGLKTGLRNIAKNLMKEQLPQGKQLLQFIESIGRNFEMLKTNSQELQELKHTCHGNHFDDYSDLLKRLSSFSNGYKRNVKELINKFLEMRAELHNREGSRLGRFNSQPKEEGGPDIQSQYIDKLLKLCLFFDKNRLEELQVFAKAPLDIFKPNDITTASDETSEAERAFQRMHNRYVELKDMLRNNEIREITGDMPIRSRLLASFELLEALFKEAKLVRQDNFKEKIPTCRQLALQLISNQAPVQPAYNKLLLVRLYGMLSPQNLPAAVTSLQKSIEDGRDCIEQVKLYEQEETFVKDVRGCLTPPQDSFLIGQIDRISLEYAHLVSIHRTKTRLDRKDNLLFPNSEFIAAIVKEQFSWLFVLRSHPLDKLNQFMGKQLRILKSQNELLQQISTTRTYREVHVIRRQVDALLEKSLTFMEEVRHITGRIDKGNRKEVLGSYPTFINSCLTYLTATKQLFFCLLTRKSEPLYLSLREDSDCFEVISNFLTCIGLPGDKQWLGRLKSDWKEQSYNIPAKSDAKQKPVEKKKSNPNSNVTPRRKASDEPGELIEVEPGDEIIDDFDLDQRMEQVIEDEAIGQDNIEEEVGEELNGDAAQEDLPVDEEDIPVDDVAEEPMQQDFVEEQVNGRGKKTTTPTRMSRPESASPKRHEREKSEPFEKVLKQKQELRRHLKPLFIKMSKIESIEALLESLADYDGFHEFYQNLVQPISYQQLLNQLFVEIVVQRNKKFNAAALLQPCRENCKAINKGVQDRLKSNLLKDFICTEPRYKRLSNILREVQEKLVGDTPTEQTVYKLGSLLPELLSALLLKFHVIQNSANQVVYLDQQPTIGKLFIAGCLQRFQVKFTEDEQSNIQKLHLEERQTDSLAISVYSLSKMDKLNATENNRVYRELCELFEFDGYSKLYELPDVHKVFEGMWLGSNNEHDTFIVDEVRKKNAAKIQPFVNQYEDSLNRFSGKLQQKVHTFQLKIEDAEKALTIGASPRDRIQSILDNYLMKGRTFKLCSDGQSSDYFMLSEAQPEQIVRYLVARACNIPKSKFLRHVKPNDKKGNIYQYSLPNILKVITEELEAEEKAEQLKWEDFYSTINAQLLNGKKDQPTGIRIHLNAQLADLEQLLGLEILGSSRLDEFLATIRSKLDQKKRSLQFLNDLPVTDSWEQYNRLANKLLDKKLVLGCPASLTYCDGVLYRIYARADLQEVQRQLGILLYDDPHAKLKLLEERRSNGVVIVNLPAHTAKFYCRETMERVKRYIGEDLTIKILCQEKIVYEGSLNETVEINYFFPEMRNVLVTLYQSGRQLCQETITSLRPYDRLISNQLNDKLKFLIERKIREEEEERIRLEEQRKERERREFEERQRIRLQKELEERLKREEEQRLRRQEQERIRKAEEQRIRKEKEELERKQREEQMRREEQQRRKKEELEAKKRAELQKLRADQQQERLNKQTLLAKPIAERKSLVEKSREVAMLNPQFVAQSKQLLSKDIMLKTPEEVIDERSQQNPSELGGEEECEQSLTPSVGFQRENIKQPNLVKLNFEEIFKQKGAEQKYNNLISRPQKPQ